MNNTGKCIEEYCTDTNIKELLIEKFRRIKFIYDFVAAKYIRR